MRRISSLVFAFGWLASQPIEAQDVPNNSFTNWSGDTLSAPWITNETLYRIADTVWTLRDTTNYNNDSSSVILKSDTFLASGESAVIPAILMLGTVHHSIGNTNATISPIYYHAKPDTLYFDYKYEPVNNDSASFQFIFYKADSAILNLSGKLTAETTWKTDTIILTSLYTSDSIPDSLFIEFRSSANNANAQLGSRLWIDNIRLRIDSANLPAAIATVSEDEILVYPNPTSDFLFVDLDENFANSELEIFDLQGRLLLTQKGISGKNTLKTANFNTGFCVLLVHLPDEQSVFRKRFLITR